MVGHAHSITTPAPTHVIVPMDTMALYASTGNTTIVSTLLYMSI